MFMRVVLGLFLPRSHTLNYVNISTITTDGTIAVKGRTLCRTNQSRLQKMHKAYLKEHRPALYGQLLVSEQLYPLCREVDEAAATRLKMIPDWQTAHAIILSERVYA